MSGYLIYRGMFGRLNMQCFTSPDSCKYYPDSVEYDRTKAPYGICYGGNYKAYHFITLEEVKDEANTFRRIGEGFMQAEHLDDMEKAVKLLHNPWLREEQLVKVG